MKDAMRKAIVVVCLAGLGFLSGNVQARAAGDEVLGSCSIVNHVVPDSGATVVAGVTYHCDRVGGNEVFVARLGENGKLDQSFGSGGIVRLGDAKEVLALGKVGNKTMVATNGYATRLNADGSVDSSYGEGGFAPLDSQSADIRGDGQIVAADMPIPESPAGPGPGKLTLRRLDSDGQPVTGFGGDGTAEYTVPTDLQGLDGLALADDGSVAVIMATIGDRNGGMFATEPAYVLLRITATGDTDMSFGDSGYFDLYAETSCDVCSIVQPITTSLQVLGDGSIRTMVNLVTVLEKYQSTGKVMTVSSDGNSLEQNVTLIGFGNPTAVMPNGDFVGSAPVRSYSGNPFYRNLFVARTNELSYGQFTGGKALSSVRLGPELATARTVAYDQDNDQLVAVGGVSGEICATTCIPGIRGFVARFNAQTGLPVKAFGTNGSVTIPGNCPGSTPTGSSGTGWARCSIPQVKVAANATLKRANGRRPSMRATAKLSDFKSTVYGSVFKASFTLPKTMNLTRAAKARIAIKAKGWNFNRSFVPRLKFQIKGRTVVVICSTEYGDGQWPSPPAVASPLSIELNLKPGSLQRIRRKTGAMQLKVSGSVNPAAASRWFGPTSASTTAKIRKG